MSKTLLYFPYQGKGRERQFRKLNITDMTYPTQYGRYWRIFFPVNEANGVGSHKTIVDLSMLCSGYYEQAHRGGICRQTMAIGRIRTAVSAVGVIRGYGKRYWKRWQETPTMSG